MRTKTVRSLIYGIAICLLTTVFVVAAAEQASAVREIPPEIQDNMGRWVWIANGLRALQVTLGLLGTAAALAVTTFTEQLGVRWTKICSFVAALSIGALSAFDVGAKADSTRRAWRHVNTEILKYRSLPNYPIEKLINAYGEAEAMVGDVPFHKQETAPANP